MDCAKQTIAKDGLFGLYKGMASPLVGVTPMFALSFWVSCSLCAINASLMILDNPLYML